MFARKKSAQIREILISESAWEEMTCLFAPSLAQQQLQQINACHTNTTYTNADYSKVVVQLVSLINNIETISSTPLTQQTQSILNQIHNIRYEKDKDSVCQIIVVVNPEPNNPIITKIR